MSDTGNLFANLPNSLPEELVEVLAETESIRIERIVSTGQCSPENFWYDQDEHEFVVVLNGERHKNSKVLHRLTSCWLTLMVSRAERLT